MGTTPLAHLPLAGLVAPWAAWFDDPTRDRLVIAAVGMVVAVVAVAVVSAFVPRPRGAPAGLVAVAGSCLVLAVVPPGAITWVTSALLGAGIALVRPCRMCWRDRAAVGTVLLGAALVIAVAGLAGPVPALWAVTVVAGIGALDTVITARREKWLHRRLTGVGRLAVVALPVLVVGLLAWVGANDPSVQWFGATVRHGDRTRPTVALTFDDGPAPTTLAVAGLLDAAGVKGTFFEVGKAVDARPDIAAELVRRGHLLGNHSYHHDYWRWLDPRYPELDRAQSAIVRATGQCPAFFRPPHGQRTPFMGRQVDGDGMATVLWDVSAADWTLTDGAEIARRVLAGVQPGSVILLHDAIDGRGDADRSALLDALPRILEGLRAKGLTPVRLDELLGRPGVLASCSVSG